MNQYINVTAGCTASATELAATAIFASCSGLTTVD
jgi:hypothetical protein